MMSRLNQTRDFVESHAAVILVSVAEVAGSSPREAGAEMLVAENDVCGTIGGGRLEFMAIAHARTLLEKGLDADAMSIPLGPEIGQCCGGHVKLNLRRLDRQFVVEIRQLGLQGREIALSNRNIERLIDERAAAVRDLQTQRLIAREQQ